MLLCKKLSNKTRLSNEVWNKIWLSKGDEMVACLGSNEDVSKGFVIP